MKFRVEKKKGFKVAGVSKRVHDSSLCPGVWDELFYRYTSEELAPLGNGHSYGICSDHDEDGIRYTAGFHVTDTEQAEGMVLEIIDIPDGEYAVIELKGRVPECIHEGWKFAMREALPENNITHSGGPDLEVYGVGDMDASDYTMELWIPVVKTGENK